MKSNPSRARNAGVEAGPKSSADAELGDDSSGEPDCSGQFWGDEDERKTGEASESDDEASEDPFAGPEDVPRPTREVSSSSEDDSASKARWVFVGLISEAILETFFV